eukprot:234489-Amorphochlora_amoeboformis.AAC.1
MSMLRLRTGHQAVGVRNGAWLELWLGLGLGLGSGLGLGLGPNFIPVKNFLPVQTLFLPVSRGPEVRVRVRVRVGLGLGLGSDYSAYRNPHFAPLSGIRVWIPVRVTIRVRVRVRVRVTLASMRRREELPNSLFASMDRFMDIFV